MEGKGVSQTFGGQNIQSMEESAHRKQFDGRIPDYRNRTMR